MTINKIIRVYYLNLNKSYNSLNTLYD